MADVSIAIQHTPQNADRRHWVQSMLGHLRQEMPDITIDIVEDTEREGCWPTYLRALKAGGGASHHLVLQDDLTLCKDFIASVRKIISARPMSLISLYTNSRAVFIARNRGESWLERSGVAGPAVIWPKELIDDFIEWQRTHIAGTFPWDDARISMWLIKTSRRTFATVPSLAQHLGCQASLLGLNGRWKTAAWYIGDSRSALGIDWTKGLTAPAKERSPVNPEWWRYFQE
jgi:hypothetical protein